VPKVSPFRGWRYAPAAGELVDLISPPYDVISPAQADRLAARDPHNSVRLDLPQLIPGEAADRRYARAATTVRAWQAEGLLVRDDRPAVYAYEQQWSPAGAGGPQTQRGFVARLGLEPFRAGGPVRPHERTLGAARADRLALLRATGANLSPIIGLYRTAGSATGAALHALMAVPPDASVVDDGAVEHRLWVVPVDDTVRGTAARALLAGASEGPITIADGHHRYETALLFHAERPDAATIMTLLFDLAATPVTTLPTHRLVRGRPAGPALLAAAARLFRVDRCPSAEALVKVMAQPRPGQRLGVYTGDVAAILTPRPAALGALLDGHGSEALRWLDVSVLAAALQELLGLGEDAAHGGAIGYTSDAAEAMAAVRRGEADTAFLLDPTPVEAVLAVAEAGELMPQKSTYFAPKPATGLVFDMGGS
jgi:uncharacterized protein (DUF1015 family)